MSPAMSEVADVHPWYVVHTLARKELLTASLLEQRLAVAVFLPEVLQPWRGRMIMRPLFPRYLFVQADLMSVAASAINATPGVARLVAWNSSPVPVQDGVVAAIREECLRVNATGGLLPTKLRAGDLVRLQNGPLAGMEAVFVRPLSAGTRAEILLRFLNQETQVVVNLADLEAVKERPARPLRQRSSRGQGRPLRR